MRDVEAPENDRESRDEEDEAPERSVGPPRVTPPSASYVPCRNARLVVRNDHARFDCSLRLKYVVRLTLNTGRNMMCRHGPR